MSDRQSTEELVVAKAEERKEFVTDVDGFVYWWPAGSHGHLASCHLRILADELDRRNAPWQKSIDEFFAWHASLEEPEK